MKKNFLKVAALLIAAMLMVVSCTQEVAPVNNGLVDAKLNVAYGRDLTVSGDTKQDGITLKYTMTPAWNNANAVGDEEIYGKVTTADNKTLADDGSLGYVTPGLWTITVDAYGHDNKEGAEKGSKKIFTGTANVYFNETTTTATVFLAPVSSSDNTISFEFKMQDLAKDMAGYSVEYSIIPSVGNEKTGTLARTASSEANVSLFKMADTDNNNKLDSGFYRVNVSIYRNAVGSTPKTLVGGTTKGFLVSGEAHVTIGGNIEPSDYESVSIDAVYVNVDTAFSNIDDKGLLNASAVTYSTGEAKATLSVTDSTAKVVEKEGYTYSVTDIWTVVSDGNETKRQITNENVGGNKTRSQEFTFNSPGYKNISCTTIYSITGASTDNTATTQDKTYYFANTVNAQVYVDPVKFTKTSN